MAETPVNTRVLGIVEKVDIVDKRKKHKKYRHKISTYLKPIQESKYVDIVDNYFFRRFSPIFTTSPAPIVINKSPGKHFLERKSSISEKLGK